MPGKQAAPLIPAMQDGYSLRTGKHLLDGLYVRAEVDPKQADVFGTGDRPDQLLLNFDGLEKLDRSVTTPADYYGPNTLVGSTTTVHDSTLYERVNLVYEARVVKRVGPDFHVGCDVPVYKDGDMDKAARLNNIENYLRCIHAIAVYLADSPTTVVPLLQGTTPDEYAKCYYGFRDCPGIDTILDGAFAVYVGQRFGRGQGCQIKQLEEELWAIDATCNPDRMLLIGYGSPWRLERFPAAVTSIAGLRQFIERTDFRNTSLTTARTELNRWRKEVEVKLGTGTQQLSLVNFGQLKT